MYSDFKYLLVDINGGVCTLTLNRPDSYNALSARMLKEMIAFLKEAVDDPAVRALVITGAGKGFCAGADLDEWDELNDAGDTADADARNWVAYGHEMMERMVNFPKPVIAAVNGAAAGAGCDLTLAADVRFASTKSKFIEAYINVGYNPDNGGTYLLPRIVGWSKASEMIFGGEPVKADEALKIGLVNYLCEPENLLAEAQAYANKLAHGPTVAIMEAKKLLVKSWHNEFVKQLEDEAKAGEVCQTTEDSKEAVKAFTEKRKPNFQGR